MKWLISSRRCGHKRLSQRSTPVVMCERQWTSIEIRLTLLANIAFFAIIRFVSRSSHQLINAAAHFEFTLHPSSWWKHQSNPFADDAQKITSHRNINLWSAKLEFTRSMHRHAHTSTRRSVVHLHDIQPASAQSSSSSRRSRSKTNLFHQFLLTHKMALQFSRVISFSCSLFIPCVCARAGLILIPMAKCPINI